MATFSRNATVNWEGSIMEGKGQLKAGTGAFTLPVTFPRRIGEPGGQTSPEELIAAAHAACFSMALSHGLAQAGTPAEKLETSAKVTFVPGTGITTSALTVVGTVPGIDEETFRQAAETAKDGCPVSQALSGNVALSVDARLA